jgi:hypothetical protein
MYPYVLVLVRTVGMWIGMGRSDVLGVAILCNHSRALAQAVHAQSRTRVLEIAALPFRTTMLHRPYIVLQCHVHVIVVSDGFRVGT